MSAIHVTPLTEQQAYTEPEGRPIVELAKSGLLWLINATVFWPRGFSLALEDSLPRDPAERDPINGHNVNGFIILGDGTNPYLPSSDEIAQLRFDAVEATFDQARRTNGSNK